MLKIGSEHVITRSYDQENESLKVSLVGAEIELSAKDGDSVLVIPETKVITDSAIYDAKEISKVCLYGPANVFVSPQEEGEHWYNISAESLVVKEICAVRIKVEPTSTTPVYLVTKSV